MNERLNRFTSLLKQIFELDKSDLDFGIYRVMNLRKAQIEEFLTERLPQMVQETLAPFAQGRKEEIRAKMKQIEDTASIERLATCHWIDEGKNLLITGMTSSGKT